MDAEQQWTPLSIILGAGTAGPSRDVGGGKKIGECIYGTRESPNI